MSITQIPRLPKPDRKPYSRSAMTIAAGFKCNDGIVLCADRLISHGTANEVGSFAHYDKKVFGIEGINIGAAVCGAGDATLIRPIAEFFLKKIDDSNGEPSEPIETSLETTLMHFAEKINGIPNLSLLIACVSEDGEYRFIRSDGLVTYPGNSVELLGIGETSLVRYLIDSTYKPDMPLENLVALAVLIVYAAKKYCPQYCGGETDVYVLDRPFTIFNTLAVPSDKIHRWETLFAEQAPERLAGLLNEVASGQQFKP